MELLREENCIRIEVYIHEYYRLSHSIKDGYRSMNRNNLYVVVGRDSEGKYYFRNGKTYWPNEFKKYDSKDAEKAYKQLLKVLNKQKKQNNSNCDRQEIECIVYDSNGNITNYSFQMDSADLLHLANESEFYSYDNHCFRRGYSDELSYDVDVFTESIISLWDVRKEVLNKQVDIDHLFRRIDDMYASDGGEYAGWAVCNRYPDGSMIIHITFPQEDVCFIDSDGKIIETSNMTYLQILKDNKVCVVGELHTEEQKTIESTAQWEERLLDWRKKHTNM